MRRLLTLSLLVAAVIATSAISAYAAGSIYISPTGSISGKECPRATVVTARKAKSVQLRADGKTLPGRLIDSTSSIKVWKAGCLPRAYRLGGVVKVTATGKDGARSSRNVDLSRS